jgi:hypothetical protein
MALLAAFPVCPIGPNRYHGSGHWIVTGGTGRFAGASGSGSSNGHSDVNRATFDTSLLGHVSLAHGSTP